MSVLGHNTPPFEGKIPSGPRKQDDERMDADKAGYNVLVFLLPPFHFFHHRLTSGSISRKVDLHNKKMKSHLMVKSSS